MRDTVPYHVPGHTTTTTTCFAYSAIASNAQSHQALGVSGAIQLNDQRDQTTNVPASSFQNLVEMSTGLGTLYTTSSSVMSADTYDTIFVEEISPISYPDQDTSDISPVLSDRDVSELLQAIQDTSENNW